MVHECLSSPSRCRSKTKSIVFIAAKSWFIPVSIHKLVSKLQLDFTTTFPNNKCRIWGATVQNQIWIRIVWVAAVQPGCHSLLTSQSCCLWWFESELPHDTNMPLTRFVSTGCDGGAMHWLRAMHWGSLHIFQISLGCHLATLQVSTSHSWTGHWTSNALYFLIASNFWIHG